MSQNPVQFQKPSVFCLQEQTPGEDEPQYPGRQVTLQEIKDQKSFYPWKPDLNLGLHCLECLSFICMGKNIAHENILQLWQMLTYRWNIFFFAKNFINHFFPWLCQFLYFSLLSSPNLLPLFCLVYFDSVHALNDFSLAMCLYSVYHNGFQSVST